MNFGGGNKMLWGTPLQFKGSKEKIGSAKQKARNTHGELQWRR
jgi:hypothetical protein